jgi:hypothetical protein
MLRPEHAAPGPSMLLSLVVVALMGTTPCHLSLLAPASPPARLQATSAATLLQQGGCAEVGASFEAPVPAWKLRTLGLLGGAVGSVAGAVAGGALGAALGDTCRGECWFGEEELWIGAAMGFPLGAALGAHLTGHLLGGRGRWWGTALGVVGGTLLGILALSFLDSVVDSGNDEAAALVFVPLLMPAAGAIAGYELSGSARPSAFAPCGQTADALAQRAPMLRMRFNF